MRKRALAIVLMLVLFVLPLAARRLYFYEGSFKTREVPRPDLDAVEVPTPVMASFVDRYTTLPPGTVLVDLAHDNRFAMSELNVLRARLSARGQRLEPVETSSDLIGRLRDAKALVVISPAEPFSPDEIQEIETFVEKGGRLLLVTDPTRFSERLIENDTVELQNDVVYTNDLAARFGLVFQPGYLYNTVENEGNFRNIKLTDLTEHPLTQGLDQIVFYAAHAIVSEELYLIKAGGETRTSDSERAEALAVAALAADGAVLALGDLTFMSEPNNAVYDNDPFIANIADFLSHAQRQYELTDFPHFFGDEVDLIYDGDPLLDSDILKESGALQAALDDQGKTLSLREEQDLTRDTIFLGLYAHTDGVDPYLATVGVTFVMTDAQTLETGSPTPTATLPITTPTTALTATAPITPPTTTLTATAPITSAQPPTVTLKMTATAQVSVTVPVSPAFESRVEITSLGQMVVTGTAMMILLPGDERQVLIALANTETGLENAVERLTQRNLQGCLIHKTATNPPTTLASCPTGEVAEGAGSGGWEEEGAGPAPGPPSATATPASTESITSPIPPPPPPAEPEGSIIVISFDDGQGRYDSMTSAADYEEILRARFDVTVWSEAEKDLPSSTELLDYDLVIWTSGDFEYTVGEEESELLFGVLMEGIPLIISGAYLNETAERAVQRDIQVKDASHPLAQGFEAGQVIPFVSPPSGSAYEIDLLENESTEGSTTVFVRGPDSEQAGADSIAVLEEEFSGLRLTLIGFPLYLLPQEAKSRLVLNTVDWMLGP